MSTVHAPSRSRRLWALGGIGFTVLFVAGQRVSSPLRNGDLPMPDAPTNEITAYFADNAASSAVLGGFGVLAGLALLFLVGRAAADMRVGTASRVGVAAGVVSSLAVAASGVLSIVLGTAGADLSTGAVLTLRDFNFWTGGVIHVASLGLFVGLWCLNSTAMGRVVRGFGKVLAVPAVLSVASLVWFYASVLILLGRYTLMVWVVFAAIALLRADRK